MSSVTRFVGLDYHQDSVQVCVMDQEGTVLVNRSVANRWQSIAGVLGETIDDESGPVSVRAAIESCSGAAHLAEELIEQTGWSVTLGHPGMVNRMKQNPDKSDKADAWILADLVRLAPVTQHGFLKSGSLPKRSVNCGASYGSGLRR